MINSNHFDTLILKDNLNTLYYSKIKKKDYKKKKDIQVKKQKKKIENKTMFAEKTNKP